MVCLLPIRIKSFSLFFINIIIMISLLKVVSIFLSYNFSSLVVKHPFFGNSVNSWTIFIGLLLLRDSISIFMFSHAILKIILSNYFAVRPHFAWTDVALAYIWACWTFAMHIFVNIRELEHVFKWISTVCHHWSKKWIPLKTSKSSHHLVHFSEWVLHFHPSELTILVLAFSAHILL